ncbi:hypothetical protein BTO04_09150 [Polaribacter sp. SA4-10]|uniref:GEVED domain-containing protein n=1 Tax=Polaribacter sp. SA4-10 TaxID=754397 RepID=UPI000B3C6940|nr:M43 family zinc metalloprotease [Polaribacter sp. SA4-10]ARV06840.1 hypothetical protein BTO04_09150 [Polaribacter sp. SA4-10]
MKKNYLLLLITTLFFLNSYSQTCGFDYERSKLRQDPSYIQLEKVAEQRIQEAIEKRSLSKRSGAPIEVLTIPVVMHVLHLGENVGTGINISDAQIQSSINNLNQFYRGQTANSSLDFGVEFILAKRDPSNNATNGINRIDASNLAGYSDYGVNVQNSNGASYSDIVALSNWPQGDYFNIWIVSELDDNNGGFGYQGYAYFYNETSSNHGSVMMASVFGYDPGNTNGWGLNSNGDNGTVVHELGHYFHLHHTFKGDGDGSVCPADATVGTDSDGCADTVPHKRETSTCPTVNSCNNSANWVDNNTINNIMSYYKCTDRMTADQKTRVRAAMEGTSIVNSKAGIVPDPTYVAPVSVCTTNTSTYDGGSVAGILSVALNNVTFSSSSTYNDNGNIDKSANANNYFEINTENTNTINVGMFNGNHHQLGIWIDWNDDGDFNDNAEQQYLEEDITGGATIQHQITYPTNIPYGDYVRIRLITDLDDRYINNCACILIDSACYDSLQYGQSEDYALYIEPAAVSTWTGANTDWATTANWSSGAVPTVTDNVVIPNTATNQPIISSGTAAVANNVTIDANATLIVNGGGSLTMDGNLTNNGAFNIKSDAATNGSLIVKGTATGNVTYLRFVTANADISKAWHLISSPVNGHNIAGFLPGMAKNGTKRGIAPYINTNGVNAKWAYYSEGDTPGAFTNGKGYTLKLDHALIPNGIALDFVGTLNTNNAGVAITVNATGDQYNAIGNPYTSYIDGGTFLSNNSSGILAEPTIWLWDSKANSNVGEYITKNFANAYKIAPGQGFFVKALATGTVNLLEAMQTHSGGDTFLKQENRPEIKLSIKEGTTIKSAEIFYIENKTTGFDDGYDSSLFTGVSNPFAIYTQLVLDNKGKNLAIQTLPNSNYENMVVPVGINAESGKEITFSLNASNFTSDLKIFLEDSVTNTYTRLDEANRTYKITTTEALNGIGRFYLHTSRSSLDVKDISLENVSVFKTDASTLRITGLQNNSKTNVTLFNLMGKQVFNTSFQSNGVKDIALPKLATGVYVVKLKTDKGNLSKKIILE